MKYLVYLYQNKILKLLNKLGSLFTRYFSRFTLYKSLITHHSSRFTNLVLILTLLASSCNNTTDTKDTFDIQGHRGCRGLMPENTIEGFIRAIDLGVTTLEMDLVISKDNKVLVSHEPYMSASICLDSSGAEIPAQFQMNWNIYEMNYQQIRKFDCGSSALFDFPEQLKMVTYKPLLEEVIDTVEKYIAAKKLPKVYYNIELKGGSKYEAYLNENKVERVKFFPKPEEFARLVLEVVREKKIVDRTIIQSFDWYCLRAAKELEPKIKIAQLIHNSNQLAYKLNIQNLGFKPDIYSPEHNKVIPGMISYMKEQEIKVIPWTVNDIERMHLLIEMGVDGIITDYPDRLIALLKTY